MEVSSLSWQSDATIASPPGSGTPMSGIPPPANPLAPSPMASHGHALSMGGHAHHMGQAHHMGGAKGSSSVVNISVAATAVPLDCAEAVTPAGSAYDQDAAAQASGGSGAMGAAVQHGPGSTDPAPEVCSSVIAIAEHCPAALWKPQWSLDHFELRAKLYEGPISAVWRAVDRRSGITVAVKAYKRAALNEMERHQVAREIWLHAQLCHPAVIAMYAAWKDRAHIYLVLEWADEGNVWGFMAGCGGVLDERTAVPLVLEPALGALAHIHSLGVIHRDLKPENLLMTSSFQLKIADFGLSIHQLYEVANTRLGTIDYIAPEVLECPEKQRPGDHKEAPAAWYTAKVDVWSMGVLAYEMLTGAAPFRARNDRETLDAIRSVSDIPIPPTLSPGAADFIRRALTRDPAQRPSVAELLSHPWIVSLSGAARFRGPHGPQRGVRGARWSEDGAAAGAASSAALAASGDVAGGPVGCGSVGGMGAGGMGQQGFPVQGGWSGAGMEQVYSRGEGEVAGGVVTGGGAAPLRARRGAESGMGPATDPTAGVLADPAGTAGMPMVCGAWGSGTMQEATHPLPDLAGHVTLLNGHGPAPCGYYQTGAGAGVGQGALIGSPTTRHFHHRNLSVPGDGPGPSPLYRRTGSLVTAGTAAGLYTPRMQPQAHVMQQYQADAYGGHQQMQQDRGPGLGLGWGQAPAAAAADHDSYVSRHQAGMLGCQQQGTPATSHFDIMQASGYGQPQLVNQHDGGASYQGLPGGLSGAYGLHGCGGAAAHDMAEIGDSDMGLDELSLACCEGELSPGGL